MINKWFTLYVLFGAQMIFAQQQLTIEKIWKNGEFAEKGVSGFNGLKNGEEFTKLNQDSKGSSITVHSYKNYKGDALKVPSLRFHLMVKKLHTFLKIIFMSKI